MNKKMIKTVVVFVMAAILLTACGNEKRAGEYYKEGMEFFHKEAYKESAEALKEAVKKNPEKAEYYIAYGMSLIKIDNYEDALIQFDKAIINKKNQVVRENNKKAYRGKGIAYYESKQYENAIKAFDSAIEIDELDELNLDILSYKADSEGKSGNYDSAIKTYSEIIKLRKKDANGYGKRAQMEALLGKNKLALVDYDKAIALSKNNYNFYFGKYFLYKQMEDAKGAKLVLDKALAIKTKTDEDYLNVAKIHYYQEDYQKAKSEFNELIKKDFSEAYYYLGRIGEVESDYTMAATNYENYLNSSVGKNSTQAYNQLGICYIKMEQYEKAINIVEAGIKLNDSVWIKTLYYNEIVALEHLARFDEALIKAKAYLEAYPEEEDMMREYEFIQTRVEDKNEITKEN